MTKKEKKELALKLKAEINARKTQRETSLPSKEDNEKQNRKRYHPRHKEEDEFAKYLRAKRNKKNKYDL